MYLVDFALDEDSAENISGKKDNVDLFSQLDVFFVNIFFPVKLQMNEVQVNLCSQI